MSDPAILFLKPKAISAKDKKTLQTAGVIVVEIDNPQDAKFVRANSELSGSDLLAAAVKAIREGNYPGVHVAFAKAVCAAIDAQLSPSDQPKDR